MSKSKIKSWLEKWDKFIIYSVVIIFIESAIYYQVKQVIPRDSVFLFIPFDSLVFFWGLIGLSLLIIYKKTGISEKTKV